MAHLSFPEVQRDAPFPLLFLLLVVFHLCLPPPLPHSIFLRVPAPGSSPLFVYIHRYPRFLLTFLSSSICRSSQTVKYFLLSITLFSYTYLSSCSSSSFSSSSYLSSRSSSSLSSSLLALLPATPSCSSSPPAIPPPPDPSTLSPEDHQPV